MIFFRRVLLFVEKFQALNAIEIDLERCRSYLGKKIQVQGLIRPHWHPLKDVETQ